VSRLIIFLFFSSISLVSEVAYFEAEQAQVAKKLAEVRAQLASHDAADATAASSHEWRLSRAKVSRRAIGRRMARLVATEATLAVGERCTGKGDNKCSLPKVTSGCHSPSPICDYKIRMNLSTLGTFTGVFRVFVFLGVP